MSNLPKTAAPILQVWIAPRLTKIGTIAEVAANNSASTSQNPSKS